MHLVHIRIQLHVMTKPVCSKSSFRIIHCMSCFAKLPQNACKIDSFYFSMRTFETPGASAFRILQKCRILFFNIFYQRYKSTEIHKAPVFCVSVDLLSLSLLYKDFIGMCINLSGKLETTFSTLTAHFTERQ